MAIKIDSKFKTDDVYKAFPNRTIMTKDKETGQVKRFQTAEIPPLEFKEGVTEYKLDVVVSSVQAEDEKLLHDLYTETI